MLNNNRGNAMIEIVPILAIFIIIVNFALGFFGLIHSGILNSIGARNYAFETFRNRSDLRYLRDTADSRNDFTYTKSQLRFHVTRHENNSPGGDPEAYYATRRPIKFSDIHGVAEEKGTAQEHRKIKGIVEDKRASEVGVEDGVNPGWIRTAYGICLVNNCGG